MSCDETTNPLWGKLKSALEANYGTPFLRQNLLLRIAELDGQTTHPPCKVAQMQLDVVITFELATGINLRTLEL